ncbi:hypothetical protein BHF71_08665 [Vulcanibacillus modesticaldus]|uniref:ABC transporter permease n=1 Tax=Vulcanibacillus modesticaldus TaxID=337097 RepID=A0A1D2YV07_9BACI|nr:ABC transporter permease [Vulcanibacillus modesticaldus]OEF99544.1 hypothetical protein BHF71_08665 [Vulcanibacillus modesticaldus]
MNLSEYFKLAVDSLRINKLRSFLTLIGIIVGVGSVIAVVMIAHSGQEGIIDAISQDGKNVFYIYNSEPNGVYGSRAALRINDISFLKRKLDQEVLISGYNIGRVEVRINKKQEYVDVQAVSASYKEITKNLDLISGRFYSESEERSRLKVIVINNVLADKYYDNAKSAVGKTIVLNNVPFKIIGVYKESTILGLGGKRLNSYLPLNLWNRMTDNMQEKIAGIQVKVISEEVNMQDIMKQTVSLLAEKHRVPKEQYITQSIEQTEKVVNSVFGFIKVIVGAIAGVSLFVGGVGVMNIMLVTVVERTQEIGIRKAIGAKPQDILYQFIIEALILTLFGGLIGAVLGVGTAYIITLLLKWEFVISWSIIGLSFVITTLIGLFFGIYPANKAANLDPIEALRYE